MGAGQSQSGRNSRCLNEELARRLEQQREVHERQVQDLLESHIRAQVQIQAPTLPQRQSNITVHEEVLTASINRPLYPNLGARGNSPLSPVNNNYQQNPRPRPSLSGDFVFVNNNIRAAPAPRPTAPPVPTAPPAPSSTQPRSARPGNTGSDTDEVNCPTCKRQFGTKIFNCLSGHASCMDCRERHKPCGICGATITQMRNISMEEVVLQFKVPCYNKDEGCCLNFKLADMEEHLKECPFREVQCILPRELCVWKGKLSQLATHIENFHPSHKGDVDTEMFVQINNIHKRMQLIKIGNYNFIFNLNVSREKNCIYITVQLLGTKHSASKWSYELHVYDKSAPRRKYQYIDKCFAGSEPLADLEKENKCAVIPLKYAQTFVNNGLVAYKFFIRKEVGNKFERRDASCTRQDVRRDVSSNRRGRSRGRGGFRKN